mgnify:CR=1 FL=1
MKEIIFTYNQDIVPNDNLILGVVNDAKLVNQQEDEETKYQRLSKYSEYKQVDAIKLLKALKKLPNKEDYIVKGEKRFVEKAEQFGFKVYKEPEIVKVADEEKTREAIEEKTKVLESEFNVKLEDEKKKMNDKVQKLKKIVKKAII